MLETATGAMPAKGDSEPVAYKQTLTADEYTALPEPARGFYKLVGTNYVPDIEGVDNLPGLTSALQKERTDRENAQNALKPFQTAGLTPERITELLALEQSTKVGKLANRGEYEAALAAEKKPLLDENATLKQQLDEQALDHGLDAVLLKAGVIPERLGNAKLAAKNHVRVGEGRKLEVVENGQVVATDLEKYFGGDFKTKNLYFFNGNGGAGSGATGSTQPGAGEVPTKTRAEFNALTPQQKADFSELVGQGKAQLVAG